MEIEGKEGEETVDVKVKKIAEVEDAESLTSISRMNQTRYISLNAQVKDGYTTTAVSNEVKKVLDELPLPSGYEIEYDGENETGSYNHYGIAQITKVVTQGVKS